MDKQKQIEEMAKVMCEDCIANQEMSCTVTQTPCNWVESFAKTLVNKGWIRHDKDSVVLSGEQCVEIVQDNYNIGYERGSKEAAEKILDYVYKVTANIVLRDKLAKQFGVDLG